jgi:hypothetical protein
MPTQYEKLKDLLTEFGVGFDEKEGKDVSDENDTGTNKAIVCENNSNHLKVGGYIGFSTEFVFDKDGNFISLNCWE